MEQMANDASQHLAPHITTNRRVQCYSTAMNAIDAQVLDLSGMPVLTSEALLPSAASTRKPGEPSSTAPAITVDAATSKLVDHGADREQVSPSSERVLVLDELQVPAMPRLEEALSGGTASNTKVRLAPRFETPPSPLGCADDHSCWHVNQKDSSAVSIASTDTTTTYPVFICRRPLDDPDVHFVGTTPTNALGSLSDIDNEWSSYPFMPVLDP